MHAQKNRSLPWRLAVCCWLFCADAAFSQFESVLDSMENRSSMERRRIALGYSESKAAYIDAHGLAVKYWNDIRSFAHSRKDRALLEEVAHMWYKHNEIFSKPESEWLLGFNKLTEEYLNSGQRMYLANCYHELGQWQFRKEQYEEAFVNSMRSLEIFGEIGFENVPHIGKVLQEIALNYYFFKDYAPVVKLMRTAEKYPPYTPGLGVQRFNNLGLAYKHLKQADSSRYFFKKTYEAAEQYNLKVWKGLSMGNLGFLYYEEEKYDSAYVYFTKNFNYNFNEPVHIAIKLNAHTTMGKVYIKLDSLSKARNILEQSRKFISTAALPHVGDRQQMERAVSNYYEAWLEYYTKRGDYKTAYKYQDTLYELKLALGSKYTRATVSASQTVLEKQKRTDRLMELEQTKNRERVLYGVFALLGVSVGGIVLRQMQRVKRERRDAERELEQAKGDIQRFAELADVTSKHLQVATMEKEESETSEIEKLRSAKILTDEDWADFQRAFRKVFPDFTTRLKKHSPSITTSEMRYLMLVKLNLSHKEMALSLGVSDSAIRMTWNRVRKRLDGTLADTPEALLQRILFS